MIPESIYISPKDFDRFLDRVENGEVVCLKNRPVALSWERDGRTETSDPMFVLGWKMDAKSKIRIIQLADRDGNRTTVYDTFTEEDE